MKLSNYQGPHKLFLLRHFFLRLVCRQKVPSAATLQLHSFQFDDFSLEDTDMLKVGDNDVNPTVNI